MADYFKGTLLASSIVRGSSGDTYGTHHSVLGVGGFMEVNTISERNALPVDDVNKIGYDGISSGQRRIGMLVYVHSGDTIYQLKINKSTWDGLSVDDKMNALADNNNWVIFVGGDASGEYISKEFTQTNHQFNVGDVIGHNGTEFIKVDNNTAKTIEPLGIVSKIIDLDTFELNYSGYIDVTNIEDVNHNSLSGGTVYYLSNVVGKITPTEPTTLDVVSKPVLVVMQSGSGIVLQYRGVEIKSNDGVDWGTFTGYTATTDQFLQKTVTGGTNLGFFSGYTGVQTLPITDVNGIYSGTYRSVYANVYRDENAIIRVDVPPDGIPRRAYVRDEQPKYSWIWDEYLTDSTSSISGWIVVEGDVTNPNIYSHQYINNNLAGYLPYYTGYTWIENQTYNNGSDIVIGAVQGSLITGNTLSKGGPVYSDIIDKNMKFRTIISETPNIINVTYDDIYIKLSGNTTSVSGGTGNEYYTGKTPSSIDLGGINKNTVLTGKTYTQLFQELLVPTINPVLNAPYNALSKSPTTTYYEIDCSVSITFTSSFNRGSITLDGNFQNYRSGLPNTHCFTGPSVNVSIPSTSLTESTDLTSYSVIQGVQTWDSCVDYDAGPQPVDSNGDPYSSPLPAGSTDFKNVNIEGVYPLYATCTTITNVDKLSLVSMISANNVEITLVADIAPDKQKFDVPDAWLSSRSLKGVCQFNTASHNWEYPGGTQQTSLNIWSSGSTSHNIQNNNINYTRYTYNSTDRGSVKIRLVF